MKKRTVLPAFPRILLSLLLVAVAAPAAADVYRVTKTADTFDGVCDIDCSLREAIQAANLRKGLDFIEIGAGIYTLTRFGASEDGNSTGDLDVLDDLYIQGAGASRTIVDGAGADRVLETHHPPVGPYASLEIHDLTIRHGAAATDGGGIFAGSVLLVQCVVTKNVAEHGGGVAGYGLSIQRSTISDNEALSGGGVATYNELFMSESTVSGNRATEEGGGIWAGNDHGYFDLYHLTVTANRARRGGGIFNPAACDGFGCPSISLGHSVMAGNSADEGPDCFGYIVLGPADTFNVFGVGEGCGGAELTGRVGTAAAPLDPRLSPLGYHGGSTPTHLPLADSPALDLVPPDHCVEADQRGEDRPYGPGCDAGSVELRPGCTARADALCLGAGKRFQVTAAWAALGASGAGQIVPETSDTGAFWFFSPDNLEIQLKVLDGCGVNGHYWVFVTGLTDVAVDLTVVDTTTGQTWTYGHAAGTTFPTVTDTEAFATCP